LIETGEAEAVSCPTGVQLLPGTTVTVAALLVAVFAVALAHIDASTNVSERI